MRNCMNISATIWPTMSVAQATRHSRASQGCAFNLRLSKPYSGQTPESSLDDGKASRQRIEHRISIPLLPPKQAGFFVVGICSGEQSERKVNGTVSETRTTS